MFHLKQTWRTKQSLAAFSEKTLFMAAKQNKTKFFHHQVLEEFSSISSG